MRWRVTRASDPAGMMVGGDPFRGLVAIDERARHGAILAIALALGVHLAIAGVVVFVPSDMLPWAKRVQAHVHDKLAVEIEIDVSHKDPPPPEQPATPPPAALPQPIAAVPRRAVPAAAAQAAAVVTRQTDPNEPVDLTNSFVTGGAATYAGGVTERGGTSATAVSDLGARAFGVGTGPVDRSRPAKLADSSEWQCPWPAEAEAEQIDDATILVRVVVSTTGEPTRVDVVNDPGHGFAREARRCAMRKRYLPALDYSGNPVAGGTNSLNIHFAR